MFPIGNDLVSWTPAATELWGMFLLEDAERRWGPKVRAFLVESDRRFGVSHGDDEIEQRV